VRRVRATTVAVEKQWALHNLSVFVALGIQHAMHMRHIVICGLAGYKIVLPYYLINGTIFSSGGGGEVIEHKLFLESETFFTLRRTEREMIKYVYWSFVMYPLFFPDFIETWIFSTSFPKTLKYQISWKSVQWEPSFSMRTDGRRDMTKLIVTFRNFANASKNQRKIRWIPDVGYEI